MLNRQIKRVGRIRPELWVRGRSGKGFRPVHARVKWLRQCRACGWNRSRRTIRSDAEGVTSVDRCSRCTARSIHQNKTATYRLDQAGAEEWAQHQAHAVQAPIDSPIAATDHCVLAKRRVPSYGNAWAQRVIEGVILVARVAGDVADQGKTDLGVVNLPGERRCLALCQVRLSIDLPAVWTHEHDLLTTLLCGRHLQRPP